MSSKEVYAVAMSGGVDSSTTAALIQQAGYSVFGVTMNIHDNCGKAIEDANRICKTLGIEHFIIDTKQEFKQHVIDVFTQYYADGLTPNPCAFCNRDIKMNLLLKFAKEKGADLMATGHYVNLSVNGEDVFMQEAKNPKKDQSYFLSLVSKENLKYVRFPLGNFQSKDETRATALKFGLHNFEKKDSQDICFIPDNDYKTFLRNFQTNANLFQKGEIVLERTSETVGTHNGTANYTIGQRKGLGIAHESPLYVIKLDAKNNRVIVGAKDHLNKDEFYAKDMNWIIDKPDVFEAFVKLRSLGEKVKATVTKIDDKINVRFKEKSTTTVTPGQICAMYDENNFVIGAGIIE